MAIVAVVVLSAAFFVAMFAGVFLAVQANPGPRQSCPLTGDRYYVGSG